MNNKKNNLKLILKKKKKNIKIKGNLSKMKTPIDPKVLLKILKLFKSNISSTEKS